MVLKEECNKKGYIAPQVDIMEIIAEKGFASSSFTLTKGAEWEGTETINEWDSE